MKTLTCLLVLAAPSLAAQTFDLGFQVTTPPRVGIFEVGVDLTLESSTPTMDGAQGWSIGVSAEGGRITNINTFKTVADTTLRGGLRDTGFEKSELTTGPGNEGAVSAVVLSFVRNISLPSQGTETIAKVEAQALRESETLRLIYVDGLRGSGQPVDNIITYQGESAVPSLGELSIDAPTGDCTKREQPLEYIFQDRTLGQVPEIYAAEVRDDMTVEVPIRGGAVFVYAALVSQLPAVGVQGWTVSMAGPFDSVSISGTVSASAGQDRAGVRRLGFERTELVDPELNDQGPGLVSAVVLSFTFPITLEPVGTATLLRATLLGSPGDRTTVRYQAGLTGAGLPVGNEAVVEGRVFEPCVSELTVEFIEDPEQLIFVGNANSDWRVDIADPIYVIDRLFRGGTIDCPSAADANEDGEVDLSDAIFLIDYLFRRGTRPRPDCKVVEDCAGFDFCL
ncbi:MAG: hypothetical protein AAF517_26045 [Planctomycetota bacterium]